MAASRITHVIDEWSKKVDSPSSRDFDFLQSLWKRELSSISHEVIEDCFLEFLRQCSASGGLASAIEWLKAVGSMLLKEYDGAELSREGWLAFKNIITNSAGILDVQTLTYVMSLFLEQKLLDA